MKNKINWIAYGSRFFLNSTHVLVDGRKLIAKRTTIIGVSKCPKCFGKEVNSLLCNRLPCCTTGIQGNVFYQVYRQATKKD